MEPKIGRPLGARDRLAGLKVCHSSRARLTEMHSNRLLTLFNCIDLITKESRKVLRMDASSAAPRRQPDRQSVVRVDLLLISLPLGRALFVWLVGALKDL